MTPTADNLAQQLFWLLILAIPIACVARTVVFEEVFREPREYCFSHYVTVFFLIVTRYQLLLPGWRGYLIAFFALVFVANAYLNLYGRLRVDITSEKKEIEVKEKQVEAHEKQIEVKDKEIQKLEVEINNAQVAPGK